VIAVAITIAVLSAAGLPVARAIDPSLSRGASVGAGFMTGCGMVSLAMMALSAVGVRWSVFSVALVLVGAALIAVQIRRAGDVVAREKRETSRIAIALDAATALSLTGYALFATLARPWEWDFWAIWGLKGRVFFDARGIDSSFLSNPDVYYSHPDYPPLLSLVYGFAAVVQGEWDDRWFGLVSVAVAASLVLVLRDEIRRATGSSMFAALATLALSGAACSAWVGLGDGVLVAFGTAGLLVLARGVRDDDPRALLLAGLLLGVGAMTKNEGLALAVAGGVALVFFRRDRVVWYAIPAGLMAAPWLLWRATLQLETDVVSGGVLARMAARLSDPVGFLATLGKGAPDRWGFWLILAALLLLGGREIVRRHGVMLVAVLVQAICYVGIYAGTVHDLASHVQTSMGRISSHLAVAVGAICALAIWDLLLRNAFGVPVLSGTEPAGEKETADVEQ
jgi:hypothetical protein